LVTEVVSATRSRTYSRASRIESEGCPLHSWAAARSLWNVEISIERLRTLTLHWVLSTASQARTQFGMPSLKHLQEMDEQLAMPDWGDLGRALEEFGKSIDLCPEKCVGLLQSCRGISELRRPEERGSRELQTRPLPRKRPKTHIAKEGSCRKTVLNALARLKSRFAW